MLATNEGAEALSIEGSAVLTVVDVEVEATASAVGVC